MDSEAQENKMAEVPVSQDELNAIVYQVATDFIETKATNDQVDNMNEETIKQIVDDVSLIINLYMEKFNDLIVAKAINNNQ